MKTKILREATPQQAAPTAPAPAPAAPAPAPAAPATVAKQQSPEQMAQAAYGILEKLVNEKIIPTITKAIADEFAKAQKGQPATKTPAPAAQAPAAPAAQKPAPAKVPAAK